MALHHGPIGLIIPASPLLVGVRSPPIVAASGVTVDGFYASAIASTTNVYTFSGITFTDGIAAFVAMTNADTGGTCTATIQGNSATAISANAWGGTFYLACTAGTGNIVFTFPGNANYCAMGLAIFHGAASTPHDTGNGGDATDPSVLPAADIAANGVGVGFACNYSGAGTARTWTNCEGASSDAEILVTVPDVAVNHKNGGGSGVSGWTPTSAGAGTGGYNFNYTVTFAPV